VFTISYVLGFAATIPFATEFHWVECVPFALFETTDWSSR
jgi:hypothetical protein